MPVKRPKKEQNYEGSSSTVTTGRIPPTIRGWMLKGYAYIALKHVNEEGMSPVRRWELGGEDSDMSDRGADALAKDIITTAQEECDAFGGRQQFALLVYDKDSKNVGRKVFNLQSDGELDEDVGPSESATPKGVTAQLMRHLERVQQISAGTTSELLAHYQQINHAQAVQLSAYQMRELEEMKMREDLISNKHARDLEMMREARVEELQSKAFHHFAGYVPLVVSKFLTGNKPGVKPDPIVGEDLLKDIIGGIISDPTKISQAQALLGPKWPQFAQLAQMYIEKEQNEEKAKEAEKNGKALPAAGGA